MSELSSYFSAMARMKRTVVPGYPHHIVQRGVRSMDVFFSEEDRVENAVVEWRLL